MTRRPIPVELAGRRRRRDWLPVVAWLAIAAGGLALAYVAGRWL